MFRLLTGVPALALLVFTGSTNIADDKKDETSPTGTWTRESNGLDLKLEFVDKSVLKFSAGAGENSVTITANYTFEKGVVKAKVTNVAMKGDFPAKPPKGLEFSFAWKIKGDTGSLDDLKGDGIEEAKPALEGEYQKEKK